MKLHACLLRCLLMAIHKISVTTATQSIIAVRNDDGIIYAGLTTLAFGLHRHCLLARPALSLMLGLMFFGDLVWLIFTTERRKQDIRSFVIRCCYCWFVCRKRSRSKSRSSSPWRRSSNMSRCIASSVSSANTVATSSRGVDSSRRGEYWSHGIHAVNCWFTAKWPLFS